ncbi:hypothetical protein F5Y16DRAFT_70421 [Xylariaceae sp. FL0255]|nr:hypothetical protein F5Y16DRAFT_70421 [Xylariaceae sp. FL0255]
MYASQIQSRSSSTRSEAAISPSLLNESNITPALAIAIGAIFSFLPAVAVACRFYCRLRVKRSGLAIDDWLMAMAFFLTLGMGLMLIVGGTIHALAQPSPQGLTPGDYKYITDPAEVKTEKIFWAFVLVQVWAFGLAKLSVLYLYRRIFATPVFRLLSMLAIIFVGIWTLGFFFSYLFSCGTRFWANWSPLFVLLEDCFDTTPYFFALAITDVITDVIILALPYYWIWRLNISLAKRLAILGVFLLGAIEIATGIIRLVIFIDLTKDYSSDPDGVNHLTTLMVWSMIEISIAVVAGCLPTIWPLVGQCQQLKLSGLFKSMFSPRSRDLIPVISEEDVSQSDKRQRV